MSDIRIAETPIPGLLVLTLPLHADSRGWFKENWQRAKMTALGLPDFRPVQQNVSYNLHRGATRGVHAEPWDKYVSLTKGRAFCAWVDLREGAAFGTTHHVEIDPRHAVFVPRGVGNAYQALEPDTIYSYLVTDHWTPGGSYPAVALDDPTARIPWPIDLAEAEVSEKDRANPALGELAPVPPPRTVVIGAEGQIGRALMGAFPGATGVDREELDITDPAAVVAWPWAEVDLVLNAAGYTTVDRAETASGRADAWRLNAEAPARLASLSERHGFTLVHFSTDYVFDGTRDSYTETGSMAPLGVYAQSKAAGDLAVSVAPRHYLLRTSWVVGDGHNFVRTMAGLADRGASPTVVDDQVGRLTFTDELASAVRHLLDQRAPFGTYNCTNSGAPTSWADVARRVFARRGRSPEDVRPVSTEEYAAGRSLSPRPACSILDLGKLQRTGFHSRDALDELDGYLDRLPGPG